MPENLSIDIIAFVRTATVLAFVGMVITLWRGVRAIQTSRDLPYFRLRRDQLLRGWRLLFFGVGLLVIGILLGLYGEPVAYSLVSITPTASLSPSTTIQPSATISPTGTLSPTISATPAVSNTPTITPTAHIPLAIEAQFESTVTPNPDARFSELTFSQGIDSLLRPIRPAEVFQNPVGHLYALFSYEGMTPGAQWTALWYRDGELVHFETKPWDASTGGLGFTDWEPEPDAWLPGNYQVQIFVGMEWKRVGDFVVEGPPHTSTPTATKTLSPTTTFTVTITPTPTITPTITLSPTPYPTLTRTPVTPSITPQPTLTRTITPTPWPTVDLSP